LKGQVQQYNKQADALRNQYKTILKKADPAADTNDTNYIFLRFVIDNLPRDLLVC
jgi:hypothetical protein